MNKPDQPTLHSILEQHFRHSVQTSYPAELANAEAEAAIRLLVEGAAPARHEDLQLYEQLARYLYLKRPRVTYLFDASTSILFIAAPVSTEIDGMPLYFPGCFLGLKREGSAEQAAVLDALASNGYIAQTAASFDEACTLIDSYLQGVA